MLISGGGAAAGTYVVQQLTQVGSSSGGTGTYQVSVSQTSNPTAGSISMTTTDGFEVVSPQHGALAISSVAVSSPYYSVSGTGIDITLAAPVSVPYVTVTYAARRDYGADLYANDGPIVGARGCVRDSAVDNSIYDSHPGYNWMVMFSAQVPALGYSQQENIVVNGNFSVNQRGYVTNTALSAGAFRHDRWKAGNGGGTYTFTQTNPDTTITIIAGTLKNCIPGNEFNSVGLYVLSWTGTAQARVWQGSASGSYASSPIILEVGSPLSSNSGAYWQSISAGTDTAIEFSTGSVGQVQLVPGDSPSLFRRRMYETELVLCKNFYRAGNYYLDFTAPASSAVGREQLWLSPGMRSAPTVVLDSTNTSNANAASVIASNLDNILIQCTATASGWAQSDGYFNASAELSL